jgi:hypothetical protein
MRDVSKTKPFEIEMGWLCEDDMKFALVGEALV